MMDLAWMRGASIVAWSSWRGQQAYDPGRRCCKWRIQDNEAAMSKDGCMDKIFKITISNFRP
jgi:hypothetical protein